MSSILRAVEFLSLGACVGGIIFLNFGVAPGELEQPQNVCGARPHARQAVDNGDGLNAETAHSVAAIANSMTGAISSRLISCVSYRPIVALSGSCLTEARKAVSHVSMSP